MDKDFQIAHAFGRYCEKCKNVFGVKTSGFSQPIETLVQEQVIESRNAGSSH